MLVSLPDQMGSVGTPGDIIGYMHTQVPEAGDHFLNCNFIKEDGSNTSSAIVTLSFIESSRIRWMLVCFVSDFCRPPCDISTGLCVGLCVGLCAGLCAGLCVCVCVPVLASQ
ncbi:hypothetical protein GOODEAATRI_032768 [Goodea atripinnis]|uniref:Uncharacterized protein n=1 Tax=Goodea atripinnis TaxID=208336 RepID=A0ABV0NZK3_9TELE